MDDHEKNEKKHTAIRGKLGPGDRVIDNAAACEIAAIDSTIHIAEIALRDLRKRRQKLLHRIALASQPARFK